MLLVVQISKLNRVTWALDGRGANKEYGWHRRLAMSSPEVKDPTIGVGYRVPSGKRVGIMMSAAAVFPLAAVMVVKLSPASTALPVLLMTMVGQPAFPVAGSSPETGATTMLQDRMVAYILTMSIAMAGR